MATGAISKIVNYLKLMDFRSKRVVFYEQLARSTENREQFRAFLTEELKISKAKATRNDSRAAALTLMIKSLAIGSEFQLGRILAKVMPAADRMMLSAVDEAKDKAGTLRAMAEALQAQNEARAVLFKSILPPMVILPGVAGFSYVLATRSIPVIVQVAPPSVWTPFNQAVRSFAEFVGAHGLSLIAVVCLVVYGFSQVLPRWTGRLRTRLEQTNQGLATLLLPVCPFILPLTIYRDFQVSLMLTSMAVLLNSGMTLTDAFERLARNSNPWMRAHIKKVLRHLQVAPTEYVGAMAKGLMSPALLAKVATTIRNEKRFDLILINLGTTENIAIRAQIAKTAKAMNMMIMVLAGALVLFLYVGQLSITQSMTQEIEATNRGFR